MGDGCISPPNRAQVIPNRGVRMDWRHVRHLQQTVAELLMLAFYFFRDPIPTVL